MRRRTGEIRAWACSRVSVARWNGCRDRLAAGERDCRCAPAPAPASAAASRAASSSPAWAMVSACENRRGAPVVFACRRPHALHNVMPHLPGRGQAKAGARGRGRGQTGEVGAGTATLASRSCHTRGMREPAEARGAPRR